MVKRLKQPNRLIYKRWLEMPPQAVTNKRSVRKHILFSKCHRISTSLANGEQSPCLCHSRWFISMIRKLHMTHHSGKPPLLKTVTSLTAAAFLLSMPAPLRTSVYRPRFPAEKPQRCSRDRKCHSAQKSSRKAVNQNRMSETHRDARN